MTIEISLPCITFAVVQPSGCMGHCCGLIARRTAAKIALIRAPNDAHLAIRDICWKVAPWLGHFAFWQHQDLGELSKRSLGSAWPG